MKHHNLGARPETGAELDVPRFRHAHDPCAWSDRGKRQRVLRNEKPATLQQRAF